MIAVDGENPGGPHVAVVGGGITGLAAAVELVDAGAQVTLLEAETVGGKLRTSRFAGRAVDEGADAFLVRVPDALELAKDVGLGDRLVAPRTGRASIVSGHELVPLPTDHLLGIPTDPDAPDLIAVVGADAAEALHTDLARPGAPPPADGDESIGTFVRRRLGDHIADRLVGPLVGGINAGNIDDLSLAAVVPQIDTLARSTTEPSIVAAAAAAVGARPDRSDPVFLAPREGMATFVEAIVSRLTARGADLRSGVAVRGLERLPHGWRVVADDAGGSGAATDTTFEVDGVVVTAPAGVAGLIVQDHAPIAGAHLRAIRHASVALVTFSYDPDAVGGAMDGSGFLVPRTEGLLCTAASWASNKWAHLAPEHGDGTMLVRASAGRADDRRIVELDDVALIEQLSGELASIMGSTAAPEAVRVKRWPSSFPQYAPGHLDRVAEIERDLANHAPTVTVAGNALRGVGIPASIRSGRVGARSVLWTLGLGGTS